MSSSRMPVLFIGHGSPMNIIKDNDYTKALQALGSSLPRPDAILVVSAHWLTQGTFICSAKHPRQIFDFYGFPQELYNIHYHPAGVPSLAQEIAATLSSSSVQTDETWGIDHAAWAVLVHMYPKADIPVLELSLDITENEDYHYALAQKLLFLREQNVLILGSGNIVHNLRRIDFDEQAPVFPWAKDFDSFVQNALVKGDHQSLIRYQKHTAASLAVPTNDHYLPMLYSIALQQKNEHIEFIHEHIEHGSISMRSFIIH